MATRRRNESSPSRPRTPAAVIKPTLTLEDWEAKAPLSESVTQSFHALKRACEHRPLPLKFAQELGEGSSSRVSTPKLSAFASSRPGTPADNTKQVNGHAHPLQPSQPIVTPQQFYDWFSIVERTLSHAQESHFREHLRTVEMHLSRCDSMREHIAEVQDSVKSMLREWRSVDEGAESLQAACEKLLEERDRLLEVTDAIALRLEYYQELEQVTRVLNHPGEALVLQADFLLMVERIDVCIEYFQDHLHFSEAELYLLRFQHCMTRAMTLIKMYFVGTLKAISADVQRRLAEKELSETAEYHVLYAKFRSMSTQVAPLLGELERRAMDHPEELSSLLTECQSTYFTSRKSLIAGRLATEIRTLDPARTDLVELTRSGCTYLKQLCTDEFELYRRFFNSGEDRLYRYLEGLCDYLYDDLRPRILHEPKLTVLGQVCTILQALMVLDFSTGDDDESGDENEGTATNGQLPLDRTLAARFISLVGAEPDQAPKPLRRLHIAHLLQIILQDAQTRLFFKAQAVMQSDIRYYAPTKADLDYPNKLLEWRKEPTDASKQASSLGENSFIGSLSSSASMSTWFPTLQKLHWILNLLHDFVNPSIFIDMAPEALAMCRESLSNAFQQLTVQSSVLDARLFFVRHLLVLKEITSMIDAESNAQQRSVPRTTLPTTTDTLGSLLRGTTSLFGGLTSLGTVSKETDRRGSIDQDLKRVCEELIASCSDTSTHALRSARPAPGNVSSFLSTAETEVRAWTDKVRLYLDDPGTVSILVAPMHGSIVREYEAYEQRRRAAEVASDARPEASELSSPQLWTLLQHWSDMSAD